MNIIVVHPSLNRGGGAEKVCLTTIKAFEERGHSVKLTSIDRPDWSSLERRFGELTRPSEEAHLFDRMPVKGKGSQALITSLCFLPEVLASRFTRPDHLIINTYGDLLDSVADMSYMNAIPARTWHLYNALSPSDTSFWRLAALSYDNLLKPLDVLFRRSLLLSNSTFMQQFLKRNLQRDSLVLYPPVDVGRFEPLSGTKVRENTVATVARLRSGKNLSIIPMIAERVEDAEFVILGLADQASGETVAELNEIIKARGVEERVKLLVNQPFDKIADTLSAAKVFLHTQPTEAFGISVVEAMAAGCVPVVPKLGGPWLDILQQREGTYGFSFSNLKQAVQRIEYILREDDVRLDVSARAVQRAKEFDSCFFDRRIVGMAEKMVSDRRFQW